jgi:hypothetical protein
MVTTFYDHAQFRTAKAALKVNIMPISVAETTYIVPTCN